MHQSQTTRHVADYLDGTLDEQTAISLKPISRRARPVLRSMQPSSERTSLSVRDPDGVIPPQLEQRIQSLLEDAQL